MEEPWPQRRMSALVWLVMAAVLAFNALFYTAPLYNSGSTPADRVRRFELVELTRELTRDTIERLSHVEHLPQRVPIVLTALAIVGTAVFLGDLLLGLALLPQRPQLGPQRWLDAFGLGMGLLSLLVQAFGLAGVLTRFSVSIAGAAVVAGWLVMRTWYGRLRANRTRRESARPPLVSLEQGNGASRNFGRFPWTAILVVAGSCPFVLLALLGAALPTTDYDALAYHLLGPKEYWQDGRIHFLAHNVYTTFPFLTEMMHLLGMVLQGSWFEGALVGQVTLCLFGPATGIAVGLLASRQFGQKAGWLAALVYLTTPWVYRISVIPYVEGALAFYAVLAVLEVVSPQAEWLRSSLLAGCLAGCAGACKYTGVVMVAVPVFILLAFRTAPLGLRQLVRDSACFALGLALLFGPWLIRNATWTGNPVFPLLPRVFPSPDWPPTKAERFERAHRSTDFSRAAFMEQLGILTVHSDWQSSLLFGFAPLALLRADRRRAAALWGLVGYIFLTFWMLTHRLDRFFLTLEPFLACLAGAGLCWTASRGWRLFARAMLVLTLAYNLLYCTTPLSGLPNYTADLRAQWIQNFQAEPAVRLANGLGFAQPQRQFLFVGYAAVFNCVPKARYNTVFDDNLFEELVKEPGTADQLKPAAAIRGAFAAAGIDTIIVDWWWIDWYRQPGSYGFPAFVQPAVFKELVRRQVLRPLLAPALTEGARVEAYQVIQTL